MAYMVILWIVSTVLVLRRAREPVAAILAFGWTFGVLPFASLGLPAWLDLVSTAALYTSVGFGLTMFPDSRVYSRAHWLCVFLIPLFVVIAVSGLISVAMRPYFLPSMVVGYLLLGVATVIRYRRTPPGTERQQLKFFTLGLVILSTCMVSAAILGLNIRAPDPGALSWRDIIYSTLIAFGFTSLSISILISMMRYRLYDADRTISRSFSVGALTLSLVGIFTLTERLIETMGEQWLGRDLGAWAGGVGAAMAAIMIVPLHKRLDHWAERRFQNKLTRFRDDYPALVGDLRETMTPQAIADDLFDRALPVLKVGHGAVLLDHKPLALRNIEKAALNAWTKANDLPDDGGLHTNDDDPLLPTRLDLEAPGHGHIGWLLLGPRPDGSTIGKDEREALDAIADPLARALCVAQERTARDEARQKIVAKFERKQADLTRRLGALEALVQQLAGRKTRDA